MTKEAELTAFRRGFAIMGNEDANLLAGAFHRVWDAGVRDVEPRIADYVDDVNVGMHYGDSVFASEVRLSLSRMSKHIRDSTWETDGETGAEGLMARFRGMAIHDGLIADYIDRLCYESQEGGGFGEGIRAALRQVSMRVRDGSWAAH